MNSPAPTPLTDLPHPVQVVAWRNLGATGRAELGAGLRRQVRHWKREALRAHHPDWTEVRLQKELGQIYLRGNT